jgi:hypothetical protein
MEPDAHSKRRSRRRRACVSLKRIPVSSESTTRDRSAGAGNVTSNAWSEIEAAYESAELAFLPDRDAEAWQPLFALLAVSDSRRLAELRKCPESLTQSKASNAEDDSLSQRLLLDLREVWAEAERHALTGDLLARLKAIEESPWAAEVELNPRKLARILRGFGVSPGTVRADGRNRKGYTREEAEAAFSRYHRNRHMRHNPHKH